MTLTREEIEKMEAGREMDVLVAEKVMGLIVFPKQQSTESYNHLGRFEKMVYWKGYFYRNEAMSDIEVDRYSTDIAAAWKVLEKLGYTAWSLAMAWKMQGEWAGYSMWLPVGAHTTSFIAPTAPLAICRAALFAVMEREA